MFNSEQGKRKMALAITHYAYRNTALEDYHSKSIMLDMLFYKRIYKIVYTKLKNVELLHKYIENYHIEKIETKGDFENLLNTVPDELRFKFMRYFSDIITLIHYNFGSDWDSAELLDYNLKNKSATNFVLSGHFFECCQKRTRLDDKQCVTLIKIYIIEFIYCWLLGILIN